MLLFCCFEQSNSFEGISMEDSASMSSSGPAAKLGTALKSSTIAHKAGGHQSSQSKVKAVDSDEEYENDYKYVKLALFDYNNIDSILCFSL